MRLREITFDDREIRFIVNALKEKITQMHDNGILHYNITARNVMIDMDVKRRTIKSVDLKGYEMAASWVNDSDDALHRKRYPKQTGLGPFLTLYSNYDDGGVMLNLAHERYPYEHDDFWHLGIIVCELIQNKPFYGNSNFQELLNLFADPDDPSPIVDEERQEWKVILDRSLPDIKKQMVEWMNLITFNPRLAELLSPGISHVKHVDQVAAQNQVQDVGMMEDD